jgi:hypothetical protein
MEVKLATSMADVPRAMRHNSEFAANATSAKVVRDGHEAQSYPSGYDRHVLVVRPLRGAVRMPLACFAVATVVAIMATPPVDRVAALADVGRPPVSPGQGGVRLDGRALADDGGPFNALGASLFWALWGERSDPDRLDANLAWLAGLGVDFVRVLGMVGSDSWSDRRVDPETPDYWATVDRFLARLARHGMRAEVTIFADAQVMMPDPIVRARFVEAWADRVNREPGRFVLIEISNEHWQNGLGDIRELRELGRRLANRTDVLVALSSPVKGRACSVYAASAADLATVHYPRTAGNEGWEAVLEPWRWPAEYDDPCEGALPTAVNNEPSGPGASVRSESDPVRLVMAYVTTLVSQNAAYVVHTGAGVRGGGTADVAAGREANLFDVPGLEAALEGMRAADDYLPAGIANWSRHGPSDASHPFVGFDSAIARGALAGAYAATSGDQFVVAVAGMRRPLSVSPRRSCTVEAHDPLTGTVTATMRRGAGEPMTLEGAEALVLTGVCGDTPA